MTHLKYQVMAQAALLLVLALKPIIGKAAHAQRQLFLVAELCHLLQLARAALAAAAAVTNKASCN